MAEELKAPDVTQDDVLLGKKEVQVLTRKGEVKTIIVRAMNWRVALKSNFSTMAESMIHILENCIEREAQKALDEVVPMHLGWLTNTAMMLTNGIDALKKLKAPAATASAPAPGSPSSTPPSAS